MATAQTRSVIGRDTPRVDGVQKVTGTAQYTSNLPHFPGMLYAVPVEATIANGRILQLDTAAAEKMPGVKAIFHRGNIGKNLPLDRWSPGFHGYMQMNDGHPSRRISSAITGNTLPSQLRTRSRPQRRQLMLSVSLMKGKSQTSKLILRPMMTPRWSSPPSLHESACKVKGAMPMAPSHRRRSSSIRPYVTPTETHNPIELHATIAIWDGTSLTLYESTQGGRQPSQRLSADVWPAHRERSRHFKVSGFGLWRQAVSMDALRRLPPQLRASWAGRSSSW